MARFQQNRANPATILGGEAAIVTPADARLHVLNRVATRVWEHCAGEGAELDQIIDALEGEFDAPRETIATETRAFLAEAVRLGFVLEA